MLTIIFLKISLTIFFLRILVNKQQRLILYVALTVTVGFGAFHLGWIIFQCGVPKNAETILTKSLSGKCLPADASIGVNYAHSSINLIVDLAVTAISIATVWKTHLTFREKLTISFLFGLAGL